MIQLKDLVLEAFGPFDLAKLVYHKDLIESIFDAHSKKNIAKRDTACKQLVKNLGGVTDALATIKGALSSINACASVVKLMLPKPKTNKDTGKLEPITLHKKMLYEIFTVMDFPIGSNKENVYGQYQLVWSIRQLCEKLDVKVL